MILSNSTWTSCQDPRRRSITRAKPGLWTNKNQSPAIRCHSMKVPGQIVAPRKWNILTKGEGRLRRHLRNQPCLERIKADFRTLWIRQEAQLCLSWPSADSRGDELEHFLWTHHDFVILLILVTRIVNWFSGGRWMVGVSLTFCVLELKDKTPLGWGET